MKTAISIKWKGTFIEYCMGRVAHPQKRLLAKKQLASSVDIEADWYENRPLLQSIFKEENWWAVDDLDHAMGFVFDDRPSLEKHLTDIICNVDGSAAAIDPSEFRMNFFAPEPLPLLGKGEQVVCHGCLRQATMSLQAEVDPPAEPSMITLSLINYKNIGLILVDMDIDGHDDLKFEWGKTTYLQPRFLTKEKLNGITG